MSGPGQELDVAGVIVRYFNRREKSSEAHKVFLGQLASAAAERILALSTSTKISEFPQVETVTSNKAEIEAIILIAADQAIASFFLNQLFQDPDEEIAAILKAIE